MSNRPPADQRWCAWDWRCPRIVREYPTTLDLHALARALDLSYIGLQSRAQRMGVKREPAADREVRRRSQLAALERKTGEAPEDRRPASDIDWPAFHRDKPAIAGKLARGARPDLLARSYGVPLASVMKVHRGVFA